VRFLALYGSILGPGLVCQELILKIYVIIFINLYIPQVTQERVSRFFNWFGFFAFGWFGLNETTGYLTTLKHPLFSY
jgi:hypothetical protein